MERKSARDIAREETKRAEEEQRGINFGHRIFRKDNPEFASLFLEFWRGSKRGEAIPRKYKELMELAIVLVLHCKPCIFLHTKLCLDAGASREEILETAQIAISMGGGVVYEYVGYLMEALEFLTEPEK